MYILLITTLMAGMASFFSPDKSYEAHEVYVSLAQMEYNPKTNSIEVALKTFTDDTDRTIGRHFRENLNLGEPNEHPQADSLLLEYFDQKLALHCGEERLSRRWYGKEVTVEETWCYFDYPLNCAKGSEVKIENHIFIEVFDAQVNIMKFSAPDGEDQSLQLGPDNTKGSFQLP